MSGRFAEGSIVKRLSGPADALSRLWPYALGMLGQLRDMMGVGVTTQYLARHFPDGDISVGYAGGIPIVTIVAGKVSAPGLEVVQLYVESGILDVFSFLDTASTADDPARLTRAPEPSEREPTGWVRFEMPGERFSYRPKRNGDSRLTPKGWIDKLRRKTPVSVYSGKLRLWAQALYGSERHDFSGASGVAISVGDTLLSPFFVGGCVLATAPGYRYWLLTINTTITARRLVLGAVGQMVRRRLLAGAIEQHAAETYMLADARISEQSIEAGSCGELLGDTLAYGWQATRDGSVAKAVSIEAYGYLSGFTSHTYTVLTTFSDAGIPHSSVSSVSKRAGISVLDSLVVPAGEYLFRRNDMIGEPKSSIVYGMFSDTDEWISVRYTVGSMRGFLTDRTNATVKDDSVATNNSISYSTPAYTEHIRLPGGSSFPIPKPTPGTGGYAPLPDGYALNDYYWDFDEYRTDYRRFFSAGTVQDEGASICVLTNTNCAAVYLLKVAKRTALGLTGNTGAVDRYARRTLWPQVIELEPPPPHSLSDGNPPHPIEAAYEAVAEYGGFGLWYEPSAESNHKNGHGYFVTGGSFVLYDTRVTYESALKADELLHINSSSIMSGTFTEGTMPGPGLIVTSVSPTPEILAYITGYDFSPGNGISVGRWSQIINLDLINSVADAVLLSFESAGGVSIFAREPSAVAYEAAPHDAPASMAMVGRI